MSTSTVIDIDGIPTAVVSRGNDKPPIVLYTIQPPPYSDYKSHRLIMQGPPPLHSSSLDSCPTHLRNSHDTLYNNRNVNYMLIRFVGLLMLLFLLGFSVIVLVIVT